MKMPRKKTVGIKEPSTSKSETFDYLDEDPEPSTKKLKTEDSTVELSQIKGHRDALSDLNGNNIIKYYENLQKGNSVLKYRYSVKRCLIEQIKTFRVAKVEAPFDRRVTFIEWHPTNPRLVAVASKGGDIFLWNHDEPINLAYSVRGIGAGGSVQAMKFDILHAYRVYTVSVEGKFLLLNFKTSKAEQFLETLNFRKWYVSLDINWDTKIMVVGDNSGVLTILSLDGQVNDRIQIHKGSCRVSHVEFSKRDPWLLCTTSNDRTIKLWDIRQLRKEKSNTISSLQTIMHGKPINAAYFSLTDGCRLLTTDQLDKIHVYRSPLWDLETEINHPHRQFQHLTPIRAYWHPYEDIILVGRYPHTEFPDYAPGELRTIDFFDADSGMLLHQHSEPGFTGIAAINRFNCTGDVLASGSGTRILIWKPKFDVGSPVELKFNKPRNRKSKGVQTVRQSSKGVTLE